MKVKPCTCGKLPRSGKQNVRMGLHSCEKKLVFSKEKLYADADITSEMIEMAREVGWPEACDGKNKEEIEELGLVVHPDWMEEIR